MEISSEIENRIHRSGKFAVNHNNIKIPIKSIPNLRNLNGHTN